MDSTEAGLRVRIAIKETTAGYLEANYEYKAVDGGVNKVIQLGLAKEQKARENGIEYKSPVLIPLITLDTSNTTTIGSGYQEYTLPTDFLAVHIATYSTTNGGTKYPCALIDFAEAVRRDSNSFYASPTSPIVYVKAEKLGFFPQPTGAGASNYIHNYYKKPTAITTTGQDLILREETHEAIVEFALYTVHLEKRDYDKAQIHLNNFIMAITNLV